MARRCSMIVLTILLFGIVFSGSVMTAHENITRDPDTRAPTHPQIDPLVLVAAGQAPEGGARLATVGPPAEVLRLRPDGAIGVEIRIAGDAAAAVAALEQTGATVNGWHAAFPQISAWIWPEQLAAVAALPMVERVQPMLAPLTQRGQLITAGDDVLRAAEARRAFGVSGAGVRIGVISDGVQGLSASQAGGDVPPSCEPGVSGSCVVTDPASVNRSGTEGRAMLEIVHDLAPDAVLGFASGFNGVMDFVRAIDYLQNEFQADIIVDDLGYLSEPFFENGTIGTRAQQAVDAGVVFVSAAGNSNGRHYQAPLSVPDGCTPTAVCAHNFTPADNTQSLTVFPGETIRAVLQWDNPFTNDAAAAERLDDLDLLLYVGDQLVGSSIGDQRVTRQPFEFAFYRNDSGATQQMQIVVDIFGLNGGALPTIELLTVSASSLEYNSGTDSIYGHPAMPGVLGVGAVPAAQPDEISSYSSRGPVTIRGPVAEVRAKPDLVATDCVETTTPGFGVFCGTSAAAPHVAAVAALLLEQEPAASPARIRELLVAGTVDLGPRGFDLTYGAGRVDALAALETRDVINMPTPTCVPAPTATSLPTPTAVAAPTNPVQGQFRGFLPLIRVPQLPPAEVGC